MHEGRPVYLGGAGIVGVDPLRPTADARMNRPLTSAGVGLVLVGVSLVASPIVLTGRETMTLPSIAGLILAPVGLAVVGIGLVSFDPRLTTVHTAFGDENSPAPRHAAAHAAGGSGPRLANPRAPVRCANCRTIMTYELARCPRCAQDRPCRGCGRPLVPREEGATCPSCLRPELFCNCSWLSTPVRREVVGRGGRGR